MNKRILPHETLAASASPRRADAGLSALGALASFGAVLAAASCCVLPLALAALPLRGALTALSLVGLAAGWRAYVRRRRTCAADRSCTVTLPSRATPIMLTIGTTLTLTALIWDRIEAPLIKALS